MMTFLKSPKAIVLAFILAAIIAWYFPGIAYVLEKPGEMYMSLLQMCVMPLLMMSIIKAVSNVVAIKTADNTTARFLSKYMIVTLVLVFISILLAEMFRTGYPISDNPDFLRLGSSGESSQPIYVGINDPLEKTQNIIDLIRSIFTSNIFVSLQSSLVLQVILFSVLVGSAAGFLSGSQKESFGTLIAAGDSIFKTIIGWITKLLPIGIICIFSIKFVNLSVEIFKIFFTSIMCFIGSMLFIILSLNVLIAKKLNVGYFSIFSKMKNVIIISASTGSPIATMPTYMNALMTEFGIDSNKVDLYIPLSIALFRFGNVYYFGFVAVLTAQIFAIPLGIYEYINITVLVFFAGFAAVSSGIVNIGLLSMILAPVGVPSSFAITLFAAIDPVIDSIRTAFTMYMHLVCAIFSLSDKTNKLPSKAG